MLIVLELVYVFFFKQRTAYEMRISDWSSDVCSSDLGIRNGTVRAKKDPTVSDLAEVVVHFGKCVKREDRRHKINRCVRLQPVPKPINNSLISTDRKSAV